jgi:hypothetical protein
MPGVVEEPDGIGSRGLQAPRMGVDGLIQGSKTGVAYRHNLEAEALERLLKQRHVVVRIGEPAYRARISFVANQQSDTCFSPRMRRQQSKQENNDRGPQHGSTPVNPADYRMVVTVRKGRTLDGRLREDPERSRLGVHDTCDYIAGTTMLHNG